MKAICYLCICNARTAQKYTTKWMDEFCFYLFPIYIWIFVSVFHLAFSSSSNFFCFGTWRALLARIKRRWPVSRVYHKACCCPAGYYILLDAVWAVTWRVVCHAFILWGPVAQWQSIKMTRPSERKKNTSNDGEQELLVRLFDVWSLNIYSAMMKRRIKVIKKRIFGWMVTGKIK